jgi:CP family cyanate transporter-like MFS transporter
MSPRRGLADGSRPTGPAGASRLTDPAGAPLATLAALFVAGLALRPQVVGVGPLLQAIQADLGISHAVASLLTTIPVLCMGLFAPAGARLARRIGPRAAMALSGALIVTGGTLRALAPEIGSILVLTVGIGAGMAIAGTVGPVVVRLRLLDRPAMGSGTFVAGIVAGSTLAAVVAVPLAGPGLDWRRALLVLSIASILAPVGWWLLLRPAPSDAAISDRVGHLPWRDPTAWAVVAAFALQSILYFGSVAWLPSAFLERGWTPGAAAAVLASMQAAALIGSLAVPLLADRLGTRHAQLVLASSLALVGTAGLVLLPVAAIAWSALLGVALGATFPLVMTLPVDVARSGADVGPIAALTLLGGYTASSLGPIGLGAARDLTGSFGASLWLLVVLSAALVAAAAVMTPARLRRGVGVHPRS